MMRLCHISYLSSKSGLPIWMRGISSTASLFAAPKKAAGVVSASARPGIEVETDPAKLTRFCCGANFLKDGSDPELKSDNEYPEWLWTLDLEPNTRSIDSLDQNTFKYWRKLRKEHIKRCNTAAKLRFM